jgi:ATP/maltotriose-dependent transcriptional regulator MalT
VNSRISPPAAAELYVPRPRIAGRIGESLRASRLVWVTASAGSGKTTAVLKAVEETVGTLAWLTVDSSEAAPGRLLKYLEAALVHACPELPYAATGALDAGSSHTEAAGLLAEALADRPLTLVIDELERLVESSASLALLETFLRYSPPTLSVVLISRRQIQLRLGSALGIGAGPIGERELAFTVAEAAQALERLGRPPADASSAVEATGGWVAGVLFEAWRSDRHVHGAGGEADPLHGYLATEIMEQLSPRARQFLIVTSVLDDVTAVRATALGQVEADDVMAELRSHHLPITYAADGTVLRCHPRFREYLEACLKLGDSTRLTSVRQAYGQLLVRERRCEEAVDQLLLAGDMEAAVAAAERALPEVLSRLDLTVADHWLSAFETDAIETSSTLTYAELLVALEREEWRTGAQCADRLRGLLAERSSTPMKAGLAAAIAWCYNLMNRIDDARSVIESAECAPETEAMRFAIDVDLDGSGVHYRDRPSNCGGTTDGFRPWPVHAAARAQQTSLGCGLHQQDRRAAVSGPARGGARPDPGRRAQQRLDNEPHPRRVARRP